MKKHVRIEYTLRDGVDLAAVKAAIGEFIAGIRAHDPEHRYTSYQLAASPRRFMHVGSIEADRLPDLQAQPFFGAFSAFLRERCEQGPEVAWLTEVASAR